MLTYYYPLSFELDAPAIITGPSADPNSVMTETYIPGSSVRGAVATRVMQESPDLLDELVLSERISYLNAYPAIGEKRALPVPHSYRKEKYDVNAVHDLAGLNYEDWPDEQLEPFHYEYVNYTAADRYGINTKTSSQLHHQQDRKAGRPLGEEEGRGTVFVYQYIERGQSFIGLIAVRGENESEIDNLVRGIRDTIKDRIFVGRSRRASYGGNARITLKEPVNREIPMTGMTGVVTENIEKGEILRVVMLSDAVIRNRQSGQIDPSYLSDELVFAIGERVKVVRKYTSSRIAGGYNRKWGLPLPQSQVAAAGSVVVLKTKDAIPFDDLMRIEHKGIGERKTEGFGRLVFLRPAPSRINVSEYEEDEVVQRPSAIPPLVREMEKRILESALFRKCDIVAHHLADSTFQRSKCLREPSNSLIGRIRGVLRYEPNNALTHLRDWFDSESEICLRTEARRQFESCQVFIEGSSKRLYDWIQELAKSNGKNFGFDIRSFLNIEGVIERKTITGKTNSASIVDDILPTLKVRLLSRFLWELVKMRKSAKNGGA
jgi:CRISPR-associated protein Csx10